MSQENVEIVRKAYEAFDRRDFETVVGLGTPTSSSTSRRIRFPTSQTSGPVLST